MVTSKADLILHPARLQILMALAERPMNTQELSEHLRGVPKSSIYRHMRALLDGGLVEIADTRPVKGVLEKSYRLGQAPHLRMADFAGYDHKDHLRTFATFLASQLQDFSDYLEFAPNPDFQADHVGYSQGIFSLTTEELEGVLQGIRQLFSAYPPGREGPSLKRHKITFITHPMPGKDEG